jgi:hypothetical protein
MPGFLSTLFLIPFGTEQESEVSTKLLMLKPPRNINYLGRPVCNGIGQAKSYIII